MSNRWPTCCRHCWKRELQWMCRNDETDIISSCWIHPKCSQNRQSHLLRTSNRHCGSWWHLRDKLIRRCSLSRDGTWRRTFSSVSLGHCQNIQLRLVLQLRTWHILLCLEKLWCIVFDIWVRILVLQCNCPCSSNPISTLYDRMWRQLISHRQRLVNILFRCFVHTSRRSSSLVYPRNEQFCPNYQSQRRLFCLKTLHTWLHSHVSRGLSRYCYSDRIVLSRHRVLLKLYELDPKKIIFFIVT